ncbi:MAG: carbon-nitrogen hydrolase family protein [Gemmatimonadetes bacterium]|nr:carbon-nitrogen hydrolase family protein [Gemmatimonadota bacterium]MBT8403954.1 carbon-nitrogen hydrolase family protein [Gemmatimonadota bacterium]NNK62364.1 carbon-nitrogen hydrolase family protein [Gemmatimonadota bacterium]
MPGRVAVVQAAAAFFDTATAVSRVVEGTATAAERGADLVVFPEAYVGGYPWGLAFGTAVGGRSPAGRRTWERYHASAIGVPGPETDRMGQAAAEHGVYLVVGVVERDTTYSGGTLFCTLLYFGPDGRLLGKHRKLKPTAAERLIWGEGDGSTLPVVDTPFGRVGGLICWENYMPLARMAMYGQGVQIYLAPTADARPRWQSTLQHIAIEGRCYVLGCNQYVTRSMYPDDLELAAELEAWPDTLCVGGSAIYGPSGDRLAGPLEAEEGILFADIDPGEIVRAQFDFDVTGHYARPDVFHFRVDTTARAAVGYGQGGGDAFPIPADGGL